MTASRSATAAVGPPIAAARGRAHPARSGNQPQMPSVASTNATAVLDAWFDDALPRIFGYFITRVGGEVQVAEDLTQETMLAAVDSRGLATADEPIAWLFGIARHKLLDHYRRQERTRLRFAPAATSDDTLHTIPDDRSLPHLDLDQAQIRDAIVATLHLLPPRQRAAVVLRYVDGLDVPTTAEHLGVSIHAAESLLARGRSTFRQHYLLLQAREELS